jgi:hypothetical protein
MRTARSGPRSTGERADLAHSAVVDCQRAPRRGALETAAQAGHDVTRPHGRIDAHVQRRRVRPGTLLRNAGRNRRSADRREKTRRTDGSSRSTESRSFARAVVRSSGAPGGRVRRHAKRTGVDVREHAAVQRRSHGNRSDSDGDGEPDDVAPAIERVLQRTFVGGDHPPE